MCGAGQVLTWLLFGGLPLCPRMLACLQPPWSLGAYPWAPSCCAAQPWVERWQPVVPHFTHTFPQPLCHLLVSHKFFPQSITQSIKLLVGATAHTHRLEADEPRRLYGGGTTVGKDM